MMRKRNKRDAPAETVPSRNNNNNNSKNENNGEALQAKNHKLAKELSECRVKQREEAKNVSRLTMENMNLASRCREAIAQAAALKKELSIQKRKTAEAVHQTHQLISQVKRMSPERLPPASRNNTVTPDTGFATPPQDVSGMPLLDDSEHKEDDVQIVHRHESVIRPEDTSTIELQQQTPDVSPIPSPPGQEDTTTTKPDAPTSSEEEESDTVPETIPNTPSFPRAPSPRMSRKSLHDSYDEEYPEEPLVDAPKRASSLLSSIDAFEASFTTNFPESFTPKDDESNNTGLYNPFDTTSPTKSDPPASRSVSQTPLSPTSTLSPKTTSSTLSPKQVPSPLHLKALTASQSNAKTSKKSGLEVSPRDTPPRKLTRQQEETSSLLVKTLPVSLNMVELQEPESPDIEVISPNGQTRITPVLSPRGTDRPDDEAVPSRTMRSSRRVGPTPEAKPMGRFQKSLTVDTAPRSRLTPLSSRSNGDSPLESSNRRASRTFHHVGSAAAKVRELKAHRDRSASAPRIRTAPSLTFSETPERPQKLVGYGTARARYERAIQSPKDVSDIPIDGRQRRNVNLSNRRRADLGNGASPLVSSPKSLVTK